MPIAAGRHGKRDLLLRKSRRRHNRSVLLLLPVNGLMCWMRLTNLLRAMMNRISKRLRRKEERDTNCLPYFLQRWRIELSWKRRLRGEKLLGSRPEVNMASLDCDSDKRFWEVKFENEDADLFVLSHIPSPAPHPGPQALSTGPQSEQISSTSPP